MASLLNSECLCCAAFCFRYLFGDAENVCSRLNMNGADFLNLSSSASGCRRSHISRIVKVLMRIWRLGSLMILSLSSSAILCAHGWIILCSKCQTCGHRLCQRLNTVEGGNCKSLSTAVGVCPMNWEALFLISWMSLEKINCRSCQTDTLKKITREKMRWSLVFRIKLKGAHDDSRGVLQSLLKPFALISAPCISN